MPPHFAFHSVAAFIGGLAGAAASLVPAHSHVSTGYTAGGIHIDTGAQVVSTNVFGEPTGTAILALIGAGAVLAILLEAGLRALGAID